MASCAIRVPLSPLGAAVDRSLGTHACSHNVITALATGVAPKFGQVAEIAFSKYQSAARARRRVSSSVRALCRPSVDGATSRWGAERRVLEHAWLVLDQLDAAVEGPVLDHLEGDVRVAVIDAFCARGAGDHREHPDSEAVDESGP